MRVAEAKWRTQAIWRTQATWWQTDINLKELNTGNTMKTHMTTNPARLNHLSEWQFLCPTSAWNNRNKKCTLIVIYPKTAPESNWKTSCIHTLFNTFRMHHVSDTHLLYVFVSLSNARHALQTTLHPEHYSRCRANSHFAALLFMFPLRTGPYH